jgi:K+-transporting ATPase c subunit
MRNLGLISGDKDEKVKASLKDAELLQQFKAVEQFTDDDKNVVKKLIDAFIVKKQLQLMGECPVNCVRS